MHFPSKFKVKCVSHADCVDRPVLSFQNANKCDTFEKFENWLLVGVLVGNMPLIDRHTSKEYPGTASTWC